MSADDLLDEENLRLAVSMGLVVDFDSDDGVPCVLIEMPTGVVRLSLAQAASLSSAISLALTCAVELAALDQ